MAFLLAVLNSHNLLGDGDTYWHIATGRWIIEHGVIPRADPFSHTLPGVAWTSHEWLSAVILYLTFQAAGWFGVVLLVAACFAAALAYLARFLLHYLEPAHALFLTILAFGMVAPHLLARPHLLALPLLVIWAGGLVRACEERRAPRLWLLGVMIAWANLHGGFTLGVALTTAFGFEAVLLANGRSDKFAAAKRWGIFLALAVLAGMLTPHGLEGYLFTAKVLNLSYALSNISEWLPPNFHRFQFLEVWLMILLLVLFTRGIRLSPVRLVILLGLVHLSLKHVRNVELLGLLSPLLMASAIGSQWTSQRDPAKKSEALDSFFNRHAQPASTQAVIVAFILVGVLAYFKLHQHGIAPPEKRSPIAAIQTARESGISGPVFNDYSFGGYLIFSGIPAFIDGRADMYGDDFFRRYVEAIRQPQMRDLGKLLEEYRVTWTLLKPNTPAVVYLDQRPGWRRIYADNAAVVHVRDAGAIQK